MRRQLIELRVVVQQVLEEVQATHPGRIVASEASGDTLGEWDADRVAQVHNWGTPITPALLPVVFEPMRRGGAPQGNDSARSVGLGLYIVKQIVDAHGGTVRVQSVAGAGTTFEMRLPRRP